MSAGIESLVQFQKDVQRALDDLDGSPVASHQMINHDVAMDASGTFAEAMQLWSAYVDVKMKLTDLSTQLKRQIEAMQMTVQYVQGTYEGNEDDFTAKYAQLQTDYVDNKPALTPPVKAP
ncbi:hypothetical protein [Streptomyces sp. SID3343]|uniref:hypothetical protein n=1 Tax=Streptomyces sp. SID3343 TaxID=2690260 RepID=UPI0013680635|nr:hypothetical protein [Streptomyces sp. SID3343]